MAAYGLGIVVAPVLGPTLGGWLTDTWSWRYAFYINIPVGILAVIMISRFVHDPPYIKNAKVGPFDNIGFGMLIVWTGCLQIVLDKGQEDDWFGASGCVGLSPRSSSRSLVGSGAPGPIPKGLVDLHILKDRNFRTGLFMIAMLGMCIYITIAILPLYYQEILGYTAFTAGLVVGPRGIGSFIGSPIIGFLNSRIDPRKLLCLGFLGFAVCAFIFGSVNLDIGPYTLLLPIMLTGFALSFVFVPLATMTTSTISRNEMGNATGLFNMLRNIGGSIGIAMATTALIRRADLYQNYLAANLSPSSAVLQQKSTMIAYYLGHRIGPGWRAPGLLRPHLRAYAAAGGVARLRRCVPLDCDSGADLRGCNVALQEAGNACRPTAGCTLRFSTALQFIFRPAAATRPDLRRLTAGQLTEYPPPPILRAQTCHCRLLRSKAGQGHWVFAISPVCRRRRRIAMAAAGPCLHLIT